MRRIAGKSKKSDTSNSQETFSRKQRYKPEAEFLIMHPVAEGGNLNRVPILRAQLPQT